MDETKKLIEKYKRELMELSRANPQRAVKEPSRPEPERVREQKQPKIIGYVSEESGEYPDVFDRFITDAMENNEIETVSSTSADESDDNATNISEELELTDNPSNSENRAVDSNGAFGASTEKMSQGTGESISNFPVPVYSSVEEFEAKNRGGGTLEFRVFAAREALPIDNADVKVTVRIDGGDHEVFSGQTDNSGAIGAITLPAPSKELSQNVDNKIQPFSLYDASVEKKGFTKVILRDIPIFDGIRSIQKVAMLPQTEQSDGAIEQITEVPNAK